MAKTPMPPKSERRSRFRRSSLPVIRPTIRSDERGLEAYLDVEERQARPKIEPQTLRRLLSYVGPYRGLLISGAVLMLLGTAATLAEPRLFGYVIDEAIIPKDRQRLSQLALIFLAIECVRVTAMISHAYLFERMAQGVMLDLRGKLFEHMMKLPVSVYDRNPVGRLVTRVTNDVAAMAEMFSSGLVTFFGNILILVGILGWLFYLNLKLGLIAAAVLPPLIAVSIYFSGKLRVAYRDARSKLSALNAFLAENILGMRVVHLFNRQSIHRERFHRINEWYTTAQVASVRVFAYFQPSITWASAIAMALLIGFGGHEAREGLLPVGVLVAFFSYVLSLFQPMRELADKWNIFLSGMASAERIFSVLDWPTENGVPEKLEAVTATSGIRGHIRFENVWFAYDTAASGEPHWVLRDFSCDIPAGSRLGIVGHTGAGKTTLISLLLRFYEPQKGRIFLDGKELQDYDKRSLRAAIGIVQQDVFLFSGSIAENLTFWGSTLSSPTTTLKELGYERWTDSDYPLQERGGNLSMGERQVLAFSRAAVAQPSIWILDEATANIDSDMEERLGRELDRSSRGRTTLMIAHRLATVKTADRILVLNHGVLAEHGSHSELLEKNGLYSRLYRYQEAVGSEQVAIHE